jgi:N-acetylglucosaminyldiphosphoundecaprenol N-acetyl-beta-D-mannosaminyltransferase
MKICYILNMKINVVTIREVMNLIDRWIHEKKSRYICLSNVHMCIEAYENKLFNSYINNSDLTLADGRPIFWVAKLLKFKNIVHIRGMDLTLKLLTIANKKGIKIGFYGGSLDTKEKLLLFLKKKYPELQVVFYESPPFRPLKKIEHISYIKQINSSRAEILFIGLGCPKQEEWMFKNQLSLKCVMIGVGAAFDFISGKKKTAPHILQIMGIEWLFRLFYEPRRLWKRYLYTNPKFIYLIIKKYFLLKIKNEL